MHDELPTDRIDFISAYCDSWCERCAYTLRCSHFAVQVALEMCEGDPAAAIELAVGRPARPDGRQDEERGWLHDIEDVEPSEADMREFEMLRDDQDERIDASPLTTDAKIILTLTRDWLHAHRLTTPPELGDAIAVIRWDCYLIGAKVDRALRGRDEVQHGEMEDDDPVQNDWNGSAKVALISIQRSAAAFRAIAKATGDAEAAVLAERLAAFQADIEREFPNAWRFIRPGFDEPPDAAL